MINTPNDSTGLLSSTTMTTENSGGVLTLETLNAFFDMFWHAPMASPDYLIISPTMKRRMLHLQRIARLYAVVMPRTRRKLRKCIAHKIQARLTQGKRRIARIEQRELREEQRQA